RRHTRSKRDWSSDVCSSDLITTKKGQKGKARVTYDGWYGSQSFSKEMPLINGSQLHDLRVEAYINEFNNTTNLPPARREKYIKRSEERRVGKERKTR